MIYVDRSKVSCPEVLSQRSGSPAKLERAKAKVFYEKGLHLTDQRRFPFTVYKNRQVREALTKLFHGKCAYCEATLGATGALDVELFRPKGGVTENPDHPGYWWLAMVWENMLPSCIDCNRTRTHDGIRTGKGNRFPLENEGNRAFKPGQETQEKPLLLDPCVDDPAKHLVFEESGMVVSDTGRGQTTISVLGLNRPHLVDARYKGAVTVTREIKRFRDLTRDGFIGAAGSKQLGIIRRMTLPEEEFAGMKRQLIAAKLGDVLDLAATEKRFGYEILKISKQRIKHAKVAFSEFEVEQSSYSLHDAVGREKYRGIRRMIEKISIKNVKAIQSLELSFPNGGKGTPWLMLLGENGSGKSTILQVVALALLGAESFARLLEDAGLQPRDYIRYRCKSGEVSVKLSGFPKPHKLTFYPRRVSFLGPTGEKASISISSGKAKQTGKGWDEQLVLLGYGATKLMPRRAAENSLTQPDVFSRVGNLFDPFTALLDAERWLLGLKDPDFHSTAIILKDLLSLPSSAKLVKEPKQKKVMVVDRRVRVSLRQLSDGYQSVVAMTTDILEVALKVWPSLNDAEGVVLLDEVGAHLHPTWKMRIVGALRKALPAMQFLATTHDPLCLRGLGSGEVAVMQRNPQSRIVALTDLPSPTDLRVDQLLTSDFFGLNSTSDPDVEEIFDRYYALLAIPQPTSKQHEETDQLREQLKNRRYLGTTLRENLMYEAIDRIVAQHKNRPSIPSSELKETAVAEVANVWNENLPEVTPSL